MHGEQFITTQGDTSDLPDSFVPYTDSDVVDLPPPVMNIMNIANGSLGHTIRLKSDRVLGRTAPGAKLSPESSRQLQEDLAEIRRSQIIGSATAHFVFINTIKQLT